jgi:hypothetical protein
MTDDTQYRVFWNGENEDCAFGVYVNTLEEVQVAVRAYHSMCEFFGMNKDQISVEVHRPDGLHWRPYVPDK